MSSYLSFEDMSDVEEAVPTTTATAAATPAQHSRRHALTGRRVGAASRSRKEGIAIPIQYNHGLEAALAREAERTLEEDLSRRMRHMFALVARKGALHTTPDEDEAFDKLMALVRQQQEGGQGGLAATCAGASPSDDLVFTMELY